MVQHLTLPPSSVSIFFILNHPPLTHPPFLSHSPNHSHPPTLSHTYSSTHCYTNPLTLTPTLFSYLLTHPLIATHIHPLSLSLPQTFTVLFDILHCSLCPVTSSGPILMKNRFCNSETENSCQ
ncbi:hypothetical protein OTU49_009977 [Cherax quadricarinatus]|uniref:Uncharacterized protein n=1 Tax=Cherax quadricarinatus TaxID=27406 RepID=A0AAW0W8T7_CHEQU